MEVSTGVLQGSSVALMATAATAEEAVVALQALEGGVAGVLLQTDDPLQARPLTGDGRKRLAVFCGCARASASLGRTWPTTLAYCQESRYPSSCCAVQRIDFQFFYKSSRTLLQFLVQQQPAACQEASRSAPSCLQCSLAKYVECSAQRHDAVCEREMPNLSLAALPTPPIHYALPAPHAVSSLMC